MTAYRTRLDTSIHLAVVTAAALITFVLGHPETSAHLLGLGLVLQLGLLLLEGMRYQRMSIFRDRVLLLERGFFVGLLHGPVTEEWLPRLQQNLTDPRPALGLFTAMGVRLRMGHLFVVYAYVVAWVLALTRGSSPWWDRAAIPPMPGGLVVTLVGALVLALSAWAARTGPDLDS